MDERSRFEAALALAEALVETNATVPVLVEGKRDVAALRALGCRGQVFPLHRGIGLAQLAHDLAHHAREVVLLTDWDRAGIDLRDAALAQLAAHGIRCDLSYHERWVRDTQLTMKDVETLPLLLARGLHKFHQRSLEDHVRALRGDPLGVESLREEFTPVPHRERPEPRARSGPKPKRRARSR